ncbi:CHAT domain-containing protein [Cyathus striatus]|nr:CHAT domain-containing protein [Cyathus striatus]
MDPTLDDAAATLKRFMLDPLESALDMLPSEDPRLQPRLLALSNMAGDTLIGLFHSTGNPEHINQAIEIYYKILNVLGTDDPHTSSFLQRLAEALFQKHLRLGNAKDIDAAIHAYRDALRLTPPGDPDLPVILHGLGSSLSTRFELSGDASDINEAIDTQQQAVDLTPTGDPSISAYLVNLGGSLSRRFQATEDPADVYRAVREQRRAVNLFPLDSPDLPAILTNLGASLTHEFTITNDAEAINEAISARRDAVNMVPQQHPNLPQFLCNLADSLSHRFKAMKDINDINEAIEFQRNGISLTMGNHATLPHLLSNLGIYLYSRFESIRDINDLEDAIATHIRVLDTTPPIHSAYSSRLSHLSDCYSGRFDVLHEMKDLEECITLRRQVLSNTPPQSASFPVRLSQLSLSLLKRYDISGVSVDFEEAIELQRRAISFVSPGSKDYPSHLGNLGNALANQYSKTKDISFLYESIEVHQEAAKYFSPDSDELAALQSKLGGSFTMRYMATDETWNLDEAIVTQQQAIDITPPTDPLLPLKLLMLGHTFILRFQALADTQDINSAIFLHRQSVDTCGDNDVQLPRSLRGLGLSYLERYKITGNMNDVHDAVLAMQRAVNVSSESDSEYPKRLNDLGSAFLQRYMITADVRDINEAIEAHSKAVSIASLSDNFEALSVSLGHFGGVLIMRYDATNNPSDINASIIAHQQALDLVPDDDPFLTGMMVSLGDAFAALFQITRNVEDLNKAISVQQQAIEMASLDTEQKSFASMLNNLGVSMVRRFRALRNQNDLEESTNARQKALELTPPHDPEYPARLAGIADSLACMFDVTKEERFLRKAHELMKDATLSPGGSPSIKLIAARHWAIISENKIFDPNEKLDAYDHVFELLPLTVWLGQTVSQRHKKLEIIGELVNTSAARAISLGRIDKALEWLEQGRSVVWNQIGALRSPIDDLLAVDQGLAERFLYVSRKLEEAGSKSIGTLVNQDQTPYTIPIEIDLPGEDPTGKQHLLAQRWGELITEIRCLPGFERFMKPTEYDDIKTYVPPNGIVVVINVHEDGCDALISYKKAQKMKSNLESWKSGNMRGQEQWDRERAGRLAYNKSALIQSMKAILSELWTLIVSPILKALELKPAENPTDRLWWCPTGPLSFLPIHAAGIYDPNALFGSVLSDYVVTSYIPTLSVLGHMKKELVTTKFQGMVAVSQANAPGLPPIPNTEKEVENINNIFNQSEISVKMLEGEYATVEAISQAMSTHNWIHLACHGTQHPSDPLESAFHAHDGSLTLSKIMELDIPEADFAFLSACQTSTGHEKLPDEAVHLAAGMLNAGYKSIIASLWSVSDACAPEIAHELYNCMLEGGSGGLDSSRAAWALHTSIRKIREKKNEDHSPGDGLLWDWVPFVHIGV